MLTSTSRPSPHRSTTLPTALPAGLGDTLLLRAAAPYDKSRSAIRNRPGTSPEYNARAAQGLALDGKFDRLAGAIDLWIAGNASLSDPQHPIVATLAALRARLFPEGTGLTQTTALEEADEADIVQERLRPEARELLAKVPTREGNPSVAVDAWVKTGTELRALARERARALRPHPLRVAVEKAAQKAKPKDLESEDSATEQPTPAP